MRLRKLRPFAAAALILSMLAVTASAEVLQLKDGNLVPGRVVSLDESGVTFAPETGGEMRVAWDRVQPYSRFELWESTLPADDAAGRVALAKWALGEDLYVHARRELLKAKGLGYSGPEKLEALIAQADKDAADGALADVDELVASGELDKALDRVRSFLKSAPPGPEAERVRARIDDLVKRIEHRDEAEKEADDARSKAAKAGKLQDWIDRNIADAAKRQSAAGDKAAAGFTELSKGNQTRAREALGASETGFQSARTIWRRVKKAAGAGAVAEDCDRQMKECDRRTLEVLIRWGRLEADNKAWKRASPIVDRGLKIDPVNRELLELRGTIDSNWIRRRISDVTNARGHESN